MYWFYAFQELFLVFPHVVIYFQCFLQRQILEKYVGHLFSANNVSRIPKQILGAAKLCQVPDNFWHFGDKKLPLFSHLELYWGSSKLFQVPDNFWHIGDKEVSIFFIWCYIEAAQNYFRYQTIFGTLGTKKFPSRR